MLLIEIVDLGVVSLLLGVEGSWRCLCIIDLMKGDEKIVACIKTECLYNYSADIVLLLGHNIIIYVDILLLPHLVLRSKQAHGSHKEETV